MTVWNSTMVNQYLGNTQKNTTNSTSDVGVKTTDRGTRIVSSSGTLDKDGFMKILAAELSNLDPTQDQDSTAYITQMSQMAALEQSMNLNTTISDFANRELIGKAVILNVSDGNNGYVQGTVSSVFRDTNTTYVILEGSDKMYSVDDIAMVTDGSKNAEYVTSMNSKLTAASQLAADKANVLIKTTDPDDKTKHLYVKGQVDSAYLSNGDVYVRVKVYEGENQLSSETKDYSYLSIIKGGKEITYDELATAEKEGKAEDEAAAKSAAEEKQDQSKSTKYNTSSHT